MGREPVGGRNPAASGRAWSAVGAGSAAARTGLCRLLSWAALSLLLAAHIPGAWGKDKYSFHTYTPHAWANCSWAEDFATANYFEPFQSLHKWCGGRSILAGDPIAYRGNPGPVTNFVRKAAAGHPLNVVILGGSVAACGHVGGHFDPRCWSNMLQRWLDLRFGGNVRVLNRALSATTSSYAAHCTRSLVPEDTDLVIVEYAFNDAGEDIWEWTGDRYWDAQRGGKGMSGMEMNAQRRGHERLLRRLLLEGKPEMAVLGVQYWSPAAYQLWYMKEQSEFWRTSEDQIEVIYKFYKLPSLSFRNSYYDAIHAECDCFRYEHAFVDWGHVNRIGNALLARVVTYYLDHTLASSMAMKVEPLRKPPIPAETLFPKNEAEATWCIIQEQFRDLCQADGEWRWWDIGNKAGFKANVTGAALKIPVHLPPGSTQTVLAIGHIRSKREAGVADVACSEGCTCPPWTLDTYTEGPTSQLHFTPFNITLVPPALPGGPTKPCLLTVTVSDKPTRAATMSVRISSISSVDRPQSLMIGPGGGYAEPDE